MCIVAEGHQFNFGVIAVTLGKALESCPDGQGVAFVVAVHVEYVGDAFGFGVATGLVLKADEANVDQNAGLEEPGVVKSQVGLS